MLRLKARAARRTGTGSWPRKNGPKSAIDSSNTVGLTALMRMPRGIRINAVSPTVFEESMADFGPFFRGHDPVPVLRAARAFSRSIEGLETGKTFRVV